MRGNWNGTRLKYVAYVIPGGTPDSKTEAFWNGDIAWFTPMDLGKTGRDAIDTSARTITQEGAKAAGLALVPPESIILSTRAPIGSVAQATCAATTNQGCKAVVPTARLDSRFSYYLLLTSAELFQSMGQGTTFTEVSTYAVKNVPLSIPSLPEQRRIAAYLDEKTAKIDRLIELRRRQIELLAEQRASAIQQAVTKGLDPSVPMKDSGLPWLGEIPAHWELKRLKYIAPLRRDLLPGRPEGLRYLGLENIEAHTGRLLLDSEQEAVDSSVVAFDEESVLFGKLRPYLAKVAVPDFTGVGSSELLVFQPRPDTDRRFLYYALLAQDFVGRVSAMVDGAKMPRAEPAEVANLSLYAPPLPEQRRIANYLDEQTAKIDRLIELRRRQIELLAEQRAALINECVTGQRRVGEDSALPTAAGRA